MNDNATDSFDASLPGSGSSPQEEIPGPIEGIFSTEEDVSPAEGESAEDTSPRTPTDAERTDDGSADDHHPADNRHPADAGRRPASGRRPADVPEPGTSTPTSFASDVPADDIDADVDEEGMPEENIPEPDIPEEDIPEEDVPGMEVPKTDTSNPDTAEPVPSAEPDDADEPGISAKPNVTAEPAPSAEPDAPTTSDSSESSRPARRLPLPEPVREAGHRIAATARTATGAVRRAGHAVATSLPGRAVATVWRHRPKLPFTLYAVVFVLVTVTAVLLLQWGMYNEPTYPEGADVDEATRAQQSVAGQLTSFVSQMWLGHQWQFLLNCIVLGVIYLMVVAVLNRFWVATALFGAVMAVFAVAGRFKVMARNEPVIPADLNFITGGTAGDLMSFIPPAGQRILDTAVVAIPWFVVVCLAMQFLDRRNGLIPCHWRPSRYRPLGRNIAATAGRLLAAGTTVGLVVSFVWTLGIPGSWSQRFSRSLSDAPQLWNSMGDAANNGPAMNFLRLVHTKVMDRPEDYSQETMDAIAKRYAKAAKTINGTRSHSLADQTVIAILSESYSDPTRVPGVSFAEDPMPSIREVKDSTTSGLMLSPGYGGGTANIEYQMLTGLSIANYDPSLSVAYQQLVPGQKDPYAFNRIWDEHGAGSVAFHSYNRNMYFRDKDYSKFGFDRFYANDGKYRMQNLTPIDRAWYASDTSTYANVLDYLQGHDGNRFVQVVTMQNHMPYDNWYDDNQFQAADTSAGLAAQERQEIDTYAKGVKYTDEATADFLAQLDAIDRPITVLFYGDHLPGIYQTANKDPDNLLALHETDYFIWSNAASRSQGTKLPDSDAAYTSSNYFLPQIARHTDSRVTPYLAFLTRMHEAVSAIGPAACANGDKDTPVYLDASGQRVLPSQLTPQAKRLLSDYRLIQYDLSVGKGYLKETDFLGGK